MAGTARAREASSTSSPASGFVRLEVATGVSNIGAGLATSRQPVVGLMFAMMSFSSMLGNVTLISPRQRLIPDELLGRVTCACRKLAIGAVPTDAAAGGLPAREFTLTTPARVAGFAMRVTAVAMFQVLNNRTIRHALESGILR